MSDEGHTLVISHDYGRYALDGPAGPTISTGQRLAICLNGRWIEGRVAHASELYANRGLRFPGDRGPDERAIEGYYFLASGSGLCGLCVGMRVRLR